MRLHGLLVHAFPRSWRDQHAEELKATLADSRGDRSALATGFDVVRAGLSERVHRYHPLGVHGGHRRPRSADAPRSVIASKPVWGGRRWVGMALPLLIVAALGTVLALHLSGDPNGDLSSGTAAARVAATRAAMSASGHSTAAKAADAAAAEAAARRAATLAAAHFNAGRAAQLAAATTAARHAAMSAAAHSTGARTAGQLSGR